MSFCVYGSQTEEQYSKDGLTIELYAACLVDLRAEWKFLSRNLGSDWICLVFLFIYVESKIAQMKFLHQGKLLVLQWKEVDCAGLTLYWWQMLITFGLKVDYSI